MMTVKKKPLVVPNKIPCAPTVKISGNSDDPN
jgi:hypothetical protein